MNYGKKKLSLPTFLAFLVFILASCFIFLVSALSAYAQTPTNYDVTVSPVFLDLSSNPGDKISSKIRIRNNTTSPIPIKLQVEKVTGDLSGNLTLKQDANDQSLSWIKFQSNTVVLKPLEWTNIPFNIEVPKDAAYGYYFSVSFAQDTSNPLAKNGAIVTGAAAVPILLNVRKEGAKADAKIIQFATKSFINEYLPVDFTIKVQNLGNIHIKPHGNIFISSGNSKNIAILDINSGLGSVIPNSARIFESSWLDGFAVMEPVLTDGQPKLDKNGKTKYHLVLNWNKLTSLRIGKYDADLLLVFDNGTKDVPLEANISFWVFPYKLVALMIITLIILIIIIRFALRFYINREIKKRQRNRASL